MIDTKRLLKVASAWISIVYAVCYAGVAIYAPIRPLFMRYALHADVAMPAEFLGINYFISGLIIWNVVTVAVVLLFAYLFNRIK